MKRFLTFSVGLIFLGIFQNNAAVNHRMGAMYLLDPERQLFSDPANVEKYKILKTELATVQEQMRMALESQEKILLGFKEKRLESQLIKLSLEERDKVLPKDSGVESVAEFSGAINSAHRRGILGKGVSIFVEEQERLPKDSFVAKSLRVNFDSYEKHHYIDHEERQDHSEAVVSVLHQMAPRADIYMTALFLDVPKRYWTFEEIKRGMRQKMEGLPDRPVILNLSYGEYENANYSHEATSNQYKAFFEVRDPLQDVIVLALENPGQRYLGQKEHLPEFLTENHPSRVIYVGALTPQGKTRGYPYQNSESRTLFTLGWDILVTEKDKVVRDSGTSFAAPTVTGAMALLKSTYPQFSLVEIADILLESAQRNFWSGYPELGVHEFVYDPEEMTQFGPGGVEEIFKAQNFIVTGRESSGQVTLAHKGIPKTRENGRKGLVINATPFSERIYGRGVLSLRRAFIYAEIKKDNPHVSKEELKAIFQREYLKREQEAAIKLQRAWRARPPKPEPPKPEPLPAVKEPKLFLKPEKVQSTPHRSLSRAERKKLQENMLNY